MNRLNDRAFQSTINSRIQERVRRGWPSDFQSVAGDLLDRGIVPKDSRMWEWARKVCGEYAA